MGFFQKITAFQRQFAGEFANAICLSDELIAAGSPRDLTDENFDNEIASSGAVYLFAKQQNGVWTELQKLVAPDRDTAAYNFFGRSVDMRDDLMAIGSSSGVYIFKRTTGTWQYDQKIDITGSTADEIDEIARYVKLNHGQVLVSSHMASVMSGR